MPKRLVDGEALWRSDKLNQVQPLEFRSEYCNLIPLAEADGTFEANARRVWTEVYSYNRPDITVDLVEEMLDEFERVGMIRRTKDENDKVWGKFMGIEARLPAESQRDKYKIGKAHLFKKMRDTSRVALDIHRESTEGLEEVKVGLVRFGMDRIAIGEPAAIAENSSTKPKFQVGLYPDRNPKKLHKFIVLAWQQVKGISAVARYPARYPQKWEELCENHPGDLIVPSFELWAQEEGAYLNTEYPVTDYLKVAAKYMEKILPTKKAEKNKYAADFAADDEQLRREKEELDRKEETERELIELGKGGL